MTLGAQTSDPNRNFLNHLETLTLEEGVKYAKENRNLIPECLTILQQTQSPLVSYKNASKILAATILNEEKYDSTIEKMIALFHEQKHLEGTFPCTLRQKMAI